MIAKLTGIIDEIGEGWIIINVNGVGYMVFCSQKTINESPKKFSEYLNILLTFCPSKIDKLIIEIVDRRQCSLNLSFIICDM